MKVNSHANLVTNTITSTTSSLPLPSNQLEVLEPSSIHSVHLPLINMKLLKEEDFLGVHDNSPNPVVTLHQSKCRIYLVRPWTYSYRNFPFLTSMSLSWYLRQRRRIHVTLFFGLIPRFNLVVLFRFTVLSILVRTQTDSLTRPKWNEGSRRWITKLWHVIRISEI